jgi:FAD:protein FMN transferase
MFKKNRLYSGFIIVLFMVGFAAARNETGQVQAVTINRAQIALGTLVEIQVRGLEEQQANRAVTAAFQEIQRIENLLDQAAGLAGAERWNAPEIIHLLDECDRYWQISDGAFDCAIGPLVDTWGLNTGSPAVPSPDDLKRALSMSGWQFMKRLSDGSWEASQPTELTFGAIGKGYAVDRAVAVLVEHGVQEGLINAGGDVRTLGKGWTAGIQHPRKANLLTGQIRLNAAAAATSGDYEQYFIENGQRYHHILDPRSGFSPGVLQSVTIIAPTCLEADALSTAVFVLGKENGMALVESLPGIEVYLIDAAGVEAASSGFQAYWQGGK